MKAHQFNEQHWRLSLQRSVRISAIEYKQSMAIWGENIDDPQVYKLNKTVILECFIENLMGKYVFASHFEAKEN